MQVLSLSRFGKDVQLLVFFEWATPPKLHWARLTRRTPRRLCLVPRGSTVHTQTRNEVGSDGTWLQGASRGGWRAMKMCDHTVLGHRPETQLLSSPSEGRVTRLRLSKHCENCFSKSWSIFISDQIRMLQGSLNFKGSNRQNFLTSLGILPPSLKI